MVISLYGRFQCCQSETFDLDWLEPERACRLSGSDQGSNGYALHVAQQGQKHPDAKPLKGFGGAGVVEIVSDYRGDAFRAVYTVRFSSAIYVLHAFQKKSKTGRETPKTEIDLIERRLREAERIEKERKLDQNI